MGETGWLVVETAGGIAPKMRHRPLAVSKAAAGKWPMLKTASFLRRP